MLRILTLPGYTQNAHIMSKRLGAIRKACGKDVEFVFIDPPHVVLNPTFGGSLADFDSNAAASAEEMTPETTPRSWWEAAGPNRETFTGFDETIAYMRGILDKDEQGFDGVFGFSQGAAMAAILAALIERPHLHPAFAGERALKPFKFAIIVGGFLPTPITPSLKGYFPIEQTPTLHVIGKTDVIISEARSIALAEQCWDSRIECHDGGHFTPSKLSFRNFFKSYINSFAPGGLQGDVPPPSSAADTPSAANTPREGSPQLAANL